MNKNKIILSEKNPCFTNKFQNEEDIKQISIEKNIPKKITKDLKEYLFNNIITNQTQTNDTNQITKDGTTSEVVPPIQNLQEENKNKDKEEKKVEIIKKDPIITQVTLTKFYQKKNLKNRSINDLGLEKNIFNNTVRNNHKNIIENKIKKTEINENDYSNNININFNNEKNNKSHRNNYEKLLKNYNNILTEIENKENIENKKMNLKFNYEGNFNDNDIKTNHNLLEEIKEKINKKEQMKIYTNKNNKNNFIKSKSKTNINKYDVSLNTTRVAEKNNIKKNSFNQIESILDENVHIKQENELLKTEVQKLNEHISGLERSIQNYKDNKKINDEQIKYLLNLKESNIISHKEKDSLIEEMKKKIFSLQKEITDCKEELNSLNEIIELNKKEKIIIHSRIIMKKYLKKYKT